MYLLNIEDFDCTQKPSDWEVYASTFRGLYNAYMKCISNSINSNSANMSPNQLAKLTSLFNDSLTDAFNDVINKLQLLMDELKIAPVNCFDKSLYVNYISSYNSFKTIGDKINVILGTGGDAIAIEPNISVSMTVIPPTDSLRKPITTKCTGVYMKQMNNGSEFIGKISSRPNYDNMIINK
jgi:hypothetical protein